MTSFITFVLSNFTLSFLLIGLLTSLVVIGIRRPSRRQAFDIVLRDFLFWALGISFLYNFVMHVFFAEMAAKFIGWSNSPFQYEVGYASLGFALVALLSHRSTFHFRLAAILGPAIFLWGAAAGHILLIIRDHNFAPGNAGVILWTDIFIPIIGFVLLFLAHPRRPGAGPGERAAAAGSRDEEN